MFPKTSFCLASAPLLRRSDTILERESAAAKKSGVFRSPLRASTSAPLEERFLDGELEGYIYGDIYV